MQKFYEEVAEYSIDRPSSTADQFWSNAKKLSQQDKAFWLNDSFIFDKMKALDEDLFG